jgi:hypothetical protein
VRGMVQQTLYDHPISNSMKTNCIGSFNDAQFCLRVKGPNQWLMTNFMGKLIFREGNRICSLCHKDRQDTVYHMLKYCKQMCRDYFARNSSNVDRLVEAVKLNSHYIEDIYENREVKISAADSQMANHSIHLLG